ncbi:MAG: hypothetical protein WCE82_04505 [Halobacteriota archaeon]
MSDEQVTRELICEEGALRCFEYRIIRFKRPFLETTDLTLVSVKNAGEAKRINGISSMIMVSETRHLSEEQSRFFSTDRVQVANADYLEKDTRIPVILIPAQHIPSS